ncbi:MAG: alpha/beta fold hydrolase [Roseibacillus sp.]|jgi:dipeptidyl aminopeptidase/acylaminoacyl peptidase
MREEKVSFYSEGDQISAILRLPNESPAKALRAVVQGPGWLGLKDAKLYLRYHEGLTDAGFAVMIFDYRGSGESEGDRRLLSPSRQLEDLVNAVTYLTTREDIDGDNIGVFGSGGTGGGNAILLAAVDTRVGCAVAQVPVADGEDWLRRMRREYEWQEFLVRLRADREARVTTGEGELVQPREEIMVPTPERRQTKVKADVDDRVSDVVQLRGAEEILSYKPIDVVDRIAPRGLMVIAVEDDPVTPTDHAVSLYERAGAPKKLILQRHTTHYAAYEQYGDEIVPAIVEWFQEHLNRSDLLVCEEVISDDR